MAKIYYQTDIAIALKYDGLNAPKVTATGSGIDAEQILAIADQYHIPLQSDPQLARILAQIPLGDEIPRELYVAVAEVIAFAYGLSGKLPTNPSDL